MTSSKTAITGVLLSKTLTIPWGTGSGEHKKHEGLVVNTFHPISLGTDNQQIQWTPADTLKTTHSCTPPIFRPPENCGFSHNAPLKTTNPYQLQESTIESYPWITELTPFMQQNVSIVTKANWIYEALMDKGCAVTTNPTGQV